MSNFMEKRQILSHHFT